MALGQVIGKDAILPSALLSLGSLGMVKIMRIILILLIGLTCTAAEPPRSTHVFGKWAVHNETALELRIVDRDTGMPLAARIIVKGADGKHVDGSGRGLYADGRFFVDGKARLRCVPGTTSIVVSSGPEYVTYDMSLDLSKDTLQVVKIQLKRWFSAAKRGWYCGDNHVHAQHDRKAAVKTDLAYTALQGRANGLDYVTEAGSHGDDDQLGEHSRKDFLFAQADEIRPGIFIGHLNTPGIREPLDPAWYAQVRKKPLPAQAIAAKVRELGGVTIHTHPLTPRHQLHWMGAGELWSDMNNTNNINYY
jgi:hypothetical protein